MLNSLPPTYRAACLLRQVLATIAAFLLVALPTDAVAAPADQDFESLSATEGANGNGSLTVGDLNFSANGSAAVETYGVSSYWGGSFTGHSGKAVIGNYDGSTSTSITYFRFSSVNLADDFRLNSMTVLANEIESGYNYAVKYKVEGFNGGPSGSLVVSVSEVNLLTSGTYGSGNAAITYTRSGSFASDWANGGSLVFGSAWDNIDTVVFTATDGRAVQLSLDSLDFSAPTPANNSPTDLALSNSFVGQSGGANATVGTLSTTDADVSDTHTYTLVAGTGDTGNASFNISESSLRANDAGALAAGEYSVRVQTDDNNGGTYAEAFSITVADDVAPMVVSVSAPTNGTYRASVFLDFTVSFTETVTVLGVPALEVTVGSTLRTATFHSGGGTTNLVFRHTVQSGDEDTDGVAVGSLVPAGGTIRDGAANDAVLTLNSVASTAGVLVDGVAPLISSITRKTPSQQVVDTATLVFEVTFSEDVTNVETSVFAVTPVNGGTITGTVSGVSGGPRIYDVTVEITGGLGEFRLDVNGQ
ncbi:MAG TPA: hypothetical protein VLD18_07930 [Verrucomicrobiae bacterium]|nr:hypothetical protein [Verrucomicrobiae bacterium]